MKTILITFIGLLFTINLTFAQHAHFTTSGTIEYEKSVNMYAIIKKSYTNMQGITLQVFESYQKTQPQFKVLKSTLTFNADKTLFTPQPDESTSNNYFGDLPMSIQRNIVYTDLAAGSTIAQKNVFDETMLLKDTTRKINWKITGETRDIAGYTCRRANALVLDSVYVVAFYTNEIHVSGGPESFTGLPGMILELAIPHENVIWRATKVNDTAILPATIAPPKKGKVQTSKQLSETVKSIMKGRGTQQQIDLMVHDLLL